MMYQLSEIKPRKKPRPKYRKPEAVRELERMADAEARQKHPTIHIEIKHGRDRLSEAQKKIQNQVTQSGGLYFVAHNFTDFKEWFDQS